MKLISAFVFALAASIAAFAQVATPSGPATGSAVVQLLETPASMPAIGSTCSSYNVEYLNSQSGEERVCMQGTIQPGLLAGMAVGSAIASAATIAPAAPFTHVTGTAAIGTITPPASFAVSGYGGCLVLIPDAVWTTVNTGNIAIASTAVISKQLSMCYDNATSKWYPSY